MKTKAQYIREWIACPEFGDAHYGDLGALPYRKRKIIKDFLDYVEALEIHDMDMSKRNLRAINMINNTIFMTSRIAGKTLFYTFLKEVIDILERGVDNG